MAAPGDSLPTVTDLLLARADDPGTGLVFEDQAWTWAEHVQECADRAALLQSLRRPGPFHIGVLMDNTPEFSFRATTVNELHGRTFNPWNDHTSAGGSSGGAAAATIAPLTGPTHVRELAQMTRRALRGRRGSFRLG